MRLLRVGHNWVTELNVSPCSVVTMQITTLLWTGQDKGLLNLNPGPPLSQSRSFFSLRPSVISVCLRTTESIFRLHIMRLGHHQVGWPWCLFRPAVKWYFLFLGYMYVYTHTPLYRYHHVEFCDIYHVEFKFLITITQANFLKHIVHGISDNNVPF